VEHKAVRAALAAEQPDGLREALRLLDSVLDRIPPIENEVWWHPSNGPDRRIRGMLAPLRAALAAEQPDVTNDADGPRHPVRADSPREIPGSTPGVGHHSAQPDGLE
jgi:hypothetical protein